MTERAGTGGSLGSEGFTDDGLTVVMAGTRDASWYNRPDVRSAKRWHVALPYTSSVDGALFYSPACNPSGAVLDEHGVRPADEIPVSGRCQRGGCRVRWPSSNTPTEPDPQGSSMPR